MTPNPPTSRSPDRSPARRRLAGWATVAVVAVVAGAFAFALTRQAVADSPAELTAVQDVPDDVQAELDAGWGRFTDRFAGRLTCIDDVSVELVRSIDGGDARYVVADAHIEIEIPTTPARFRESFVHELAHHVEHTCAEFVPLRDALHPELGHPGEPWAGGPVWEDDPSEQWAEAVVELVNGERVRHDDEIAVDPSVVALIEAWGSGSD